MSDSPDPPAGNWQPPPDPGAGRGATPPPQGQWPGGQPGSPGAPHPPQPPAMPYGAPPTQPNPYDSESTVLLVTGILSLVLCGLIGLYPWIKGNRVRRDAEAAGWPEPGTAKAGRIMGIIGTVIAGSSILFFVAIFSVALLAGAS